MAVLSDIPSDPAGAMSAMLRRADEMCEAGRQTSREQQVMSRALGAARANLVGHTSYFTKKFQGFNDELDTTLQRYRGILEHCEDHFLKLLTVELPATLKEQIGLTGDNLLETAPLQAIRDHEKYAAEGLTQMESRLGELRNSFAKFVQRVEEASDAKDTVSLGGSHFTALEGMVTELVAIREKQYDSRKALGEVSGDAARADALRGEMSETDASMGAKMEATINSKGQLRVGIHKRMQQISDLQTNIRKMGKTTNGYYDSLHSLDRYFVELGHVQHIAAAFSAAMLEVQRRRCFKQAYQAEVGKAVAALQQMRDAEAEVRGMFWQLHGCHLPAALLPGLAEKPPAPSWNLPEFDTPLPDLGPLPAGGMGPAIESTPWAALDKSRGTSATPPEKAVVGKSGGEGEGAPGAATGGGGKVAGGG